MKKELMEKLIKSPMRLFCFESVTSTNIVAKEFAENDEINFIVLSEKQTAGKGRLGKSFYSPDSGIYMSVVMPAEENYILYTIACAVAVSSAIKKICDINSSIKWVNDVFVDGKKVCGILCEGVGGETVKSVVMGIGVNFNTHNFPQDLNCSAGSLYYGNAQILREELAAQIINELTELIENFDAYNLIELYKQRCFILGKQVAIVGTDKVVGAIDIDIDGSLIVDDGGTIKKLNCGEISVKPI